MDLCWDWGWNTQIGRENQLLDMSEAFVSIHFPFVNASSVAFIFNTWCGILWFNVISSVNDINQADMNVIFVSLLNLKTGLKKIKNK